MNIFLSTIVGIGLIHSAVAQVVDKGSMFDLTLKDNTRLFVLPGFDDSGVHTYYYLPSNLRLSVRSDKTPEFNFMTYKAEGSGEISGAILHFLLVWGLTPDQEKEVEALIRSTLDTNAILAGVVSLEIPQGINSFMINGSTKVAQLLRSRLRSEPVAPVIPSTKIAMSYKLTGEEALMFQEAMTTPSHLDSVQIELNFQFRGGFRSYWYNQFKTDIYTLKASLLDILKPVSNEQKVKQ